MDAEAAVRFARFAPRAAGRARTRPTSFPHIGWRGEAGRRLSTFVWLQPMGMGACPTKPRQNGRAGRGPAERACVAKAEPSVHHLQKDGRRLSPRMVPTAPTLLYDRHVAGATM